MKKRNKETVVMVMGAGGTAGINFIECLRMSQGKYRIIGCDINRWHLELPKVDRKYIVPYSIEAGYIEALNEIIEKERVLYSCPAGYGSRGDLREQGETENRAPASCC